MFQKNIRRLDHFKSLVCEIISVGSGMVDVFGKKVKGLDQ